MASKNSSTTKAQGDELPFGTIQGEPGKGAGKAASGKGDPDRGGSDQVDGAGPEGTRAKRGTRRASSPRKRAQDEPAGAEAAGSRAARDRAEPDAAQAKERNGTDRPRESSGDGGSRRDPDEPRREGRERSGGSRSEGERRPAGEPRDENRGERGAEQPRREGKRRNRRGGRRRRGRDQRDPSRDQREPSQSTQPTQPTQQRDQRDQGGQRGQRGQRDGGRREQPSAPKTAQVASGMFVLEKGDYGTLRCADSMWKPSKEDVYVPKRLIDREKLRDGSIVEGRVSKGQKHKYQLHEVLSVDGRPPAEVRNKPAFANLTSIDPDFHYAIGDITKNVSMRIVDLLCPIGRGQRGLIVAPPRSGKTTLLREFAHGIEVGYPDVHLMVVLVDERPEEATEWRRSVERGQVFVSTADETAKNHIQVAEIAWKRACRLVELGEDVVLLLDSITRLARAYNNQAGAGGRTMSGGLDSRAMERPRKLFGSARNTESAGSLTILGTTLIDTGSRLDQLVFEEFKGTGNMELVLSRRLADRRIFPALDVERSGTRKEEKLVGMRRLKLLHTLRRVLTRMNFVEAMELLITKLIDVEKTDDFLNRFEVDPEA